MPYRAGKIFKTVEKGRIIFSSIKFTIPKIAVYLRKIILLAMIFDENILQSIELFGQAGKPPALIARELGLTSSQLEDERNKDEKLNNALKRAEFNFKEIIKAKMFSDAMTEKNPGLWREVNILLQEDSRAMDNEIIIREVE